MSVVSLSTLKEYLPELQGSGSDTELQNLLDRVESVIAQFLGYPSSYDTGTNTFSAPKLEDTSYTLFIDGPIYDLRFVLPLPIKPVNSVTNWYSDVDRLYGSDSEIQSSEYDLDNENSRLIIKSTSSKAIETGFKANKVVCNAGFTSAPADLEHAICVYCVHLQRAKNSQGKDNTTQRESTIKLSPRTMPPEVKEVLYPYLVSKRVI